ncbi:MAG: enoyl-CoA hydratase [Deltaproteobacteria bacterium]|nr:enoyl-CoA hydratase [Deltaproteobacteria bacterium]MBW2445788.1 enoyl-CoA hydratase [Deltaproteobacteria bacterium]
MSQAADGDGATVDGVRFEQPAEGVARIVLARPEARNAQDKAMLYALNAAFDRAAHDDEVRVIILAGDGPHFSSGHDLRDASQISDFPPVGNWGGTAQPGIEGYMASEHEIYLGLCWRWRNLPKPTIAQVQGKVIAGGLMLAWVCDLIVAAEDAEFSDPVVAFGVNGGEYFAHPWEVGARKAKEMLFTGEALTAAEAKQLGMVNRVVSGERLEAYTLEMASHVAERPSMGLKLAKQSVNQMQDAQGLWTSLQAAMSLHQLGHSNDWQVHGVGIDPAGVGIIRKQAKAPPKFRD